METSAVSLAHADLRAARRHAIIFVLSASATFTVGSALVKALTADFPVMEIVMFRSFVGFIAMMPMIFRGGGLSVLKTRRPVGHVMRTIYGFIGTVTSVYGFGVLPLVTVTALGFAMPLFLTIVSVPLLGERVGPRRATAVVVGLIGVMVMLRPWHVEADMPIGAVAIVIARGAHLVVVDDQHPPDGRRGRTQRHDRHVVQPGDGVVGSGLLPVGLGDADPLATWHSDLCRSDVGLRATADDRGVSCRRDHPGGAVRVRRDHLRDFAGYRDLGRMAGCLEPGRRGHPDRVRALHLAPGSDAGAAAVGA